jgi:putative endonuclease
MTEDGESRGRRNGHAVGRLAEDLAEAFLISRGMTILCRNFRCRGGEIDLVAMDREVLVFVEVKARRTRTFGPAAESIGHIKRTRLRRAATVFLATQRGPGEPPPCRFDALVVDPGEGDLARGVFRHLMDVL